MLTIARSSLSLRLGGLLLFALLGAALLLLSCSSGPSAKQQAARKLALSFLQASGNYTPDTIDAAYESTKALLTAEAQSSFLESEFQAERLAVKASGRQQKLLINTETLEVEEIDEDSSVVFIVGSRERIVRGKTSPSVALLYTVYVEHDVSKNQPPKIHEIKREPLAGQTQQLSEEVLLERFNQASEAAAIERKEFLKTVGAVRKDLKEHEKKVEQDFKRLSDSLDKLGTTVKKLGEDVKERTKKKQRAVKQSPQANTPSVTQSTTKTE